MKYEEWIKYEEIRKKMAGFKPWVLLEPDLFKVTKGPDSPNHQPEKSRLLSAILQVFNPRSI